MKRPLVISLVAVAALAAIPAAPATAAFPGRNGQLVFQRFGPVSGLGDIYSITASGKGELNLTATPPVEDRDPAWSADGERIAFRRGGAGADQLWVMDGDGGGLAVVPGSGTASNPNWSPDGKRLVYECWAPFTTDTDICLRDVGGGFARLAAGLTGAPGVSGRSSARRRGWCRRRRAATPGRRPWCRRR